MFVGGADCEGDSVNACKVKQLRESLERSVNRQVETCRYIIGMFERQRKVRTSFFVRSSNWGLQIKYERIITSYR